MTKNKKKQVNTNPGESPFRKGQGSDESYGIDQYKKEIDTAFGEYRDMSADKDLTGNIWDVAENKMNIGNNFGGVKTDFDNQYANIDSTQIKNRFAGMENTAEDLTVNMKAANFQKQMSQQGAANAMQTFKGAAGSSGVAGLAQAMANQQSGVAQQISGDIGQQEQANQRLAAQQGMSIQQMEAQGATGVDAARMSAELAKSGGAQAAMQLGSQAQLSQAGGLQAADIASGQGAMEAQKIQLQGAADSRDLQFQTKQGELAFLSGLLNAANADKDSDYKKSDRRLKKNITKIGRSATGLNIYSFEYKNPTHGSGMFQGVMSNEVPKEAVIELGGYDAVNYNMLDVEFKQL